MKNTLKIISHFLVFSFIVWLMPQCIKKDQVKKDIENILQHHKQNIAPDSRIAIFDYSLIKGQKNFELTIETDQHEALPNLQNKLSEYSTDIVLTTHTLPDSTVEGYNYGVINLSVANIRKKPGHSMEMVSQAILGTPVKLLKAEKNWRLIQTPDKYIGWVDETAVQKLSKQEFNLWINSDKIIYTSHAGFVYNNSECTSTISDITAGSLLKLIKQSPKGYSVEFPDGRIGFVSKSDAETFASWMASKTYTKKAIIETALPFLGHPYLWGGTSTKGVDCSGFTKTVFFLNGIVLQRDASQQELYGENVSTENNFEQLQAGDLLFFGKAETDSTKKRITHVGIYMGNLQFIHAAGRVFIDSFDPEADNYNEPRLKTLVSVKRILNNLDTPGIEKISNNRFYTE